MWIDLHFFLLVLVFYSQKQQKTSKVLGNEIQKTFFISQNCQKTSTSRRVSIWLKMISWSSLFQKETKEKEKNPSLFLNYSLILLFERFNFLFLKKREDQTKVIHQSFETMIVKTKRKYFSSKSTLTHQTSWDFKRGKFISFDILSL